jgi:hypothetical protein
VLPGSSHWRQEGMCRGAWRPWSHPTWEALGHVFPLFFCSLSNVKLSQIAQTFSGAGTQGGKGSGWYVARSLDPGSAKTPGPFQAEAC